VIRSGCIVSNKCNLILRNSALSTNKTSTTPLPQFSIILTRLYLYHNYLNNYTVCKVLLKNVYLSVSGCLAKQIAPFITCFNFSNCFSSTYLSIIS